MIDAVSTVEELESLHDRHGILLEATLGLHVLDVHGALSEVVARLQLLQLGQVESEDVRFSALESRLYFILIFISELTILILQIDPARDTTELMI